MAGEVGHREQQVADLGGRRIALAALDVGLDLVRLLADLRQHRERIVPVEADLAGLLLQLERARQGREADRHAGKRAASLASRSGFAAFSSFLICCQSPSTALADSPR